MLVLDENMPAGQRLLLREWRIHFRVVGIEVGRSGTKDDNLIPCLHRLPNPTFFSLDRNFHRRDWIHSYYGLVWLNVRGREAANFIRRFLRHSSFNTQAKQMGIVARAHLDGVQLWQLGQRFLQTIRWLLSLAHALDLALWTSEQSEITSKSKSKSLTVSITFSD